MPSWSARYTARASEASCVEFFSPRKVSTSPKVRVFPLSMVCWVSSSNPRMTSVVNGLSAAMTASRRCWPSSSRPSLPNLMASPLNRHSPLRISRANKLTLSRLIRRLLTFSPSMVFAISGVMVSTLAVIFSPMICFLLFSCRSDSGRIALRHVLELAVAS